MTPEQQISAERLERYIIREGLSPVMNNTEWVEALDTIQEVMRYGIRFRVKDVRGPEPIDHWDGDFPYHVPHHFKAIEWLEINPVVERHRGALVAPEQEDFTESLVCALQARSIPFYQEDGIIRIQGYTRHS